MSENISAAWTAFNAGELSSDMAGRTDEPKYFSGCKTLLNFCPQMQGPVFRRGGTRYVAATKTNERVWFSTFEQNVSNSYVLEFGNLNLRFLVNRGQLLNAGVPYEIVTPYGTTDLITADATFSLRSVQSQDVMWFTNLNGNIAPQKLTRSGALSWAFAAVPFVNGPFKDVDPDNTITVQASAATGAGITLTASSAIFTAADIGTSFYVEMGNPGLVRPWEVQVTTAVNDLIRYAGNYYKATAVGATLKTGTSPPLHTYGTASDGLNAVTWLYLHSGYGWAQITAIGGGGTTATATVPVGNYIPDQIVSANTTRWAHALFNSTDGWPTNVAFFRGRLVYSRNRTLAFSVSGSYDDFSTKDGPELTADSGFVVTIAADRLDKINWMVSTDKVLLLSSSQAEIAIAEQTSTSVFSAGNISDRPQTAYGSRLVEPVKAGDAVLGVQRAGKKLREYIYDLNIDRYKGEDLTVLSAQVTDAGIVDMDFQQEPDNGLWCVLADGTMGLLTYDRARGVVAWTRQTVGGTTTNTSFGVVETVACIAAPSGDRDDVWLCVRRTINGVTVRYIEYLEDPKLYENSLADMFFVDAGITYSGAPVATITGLGHLEGQSVQILADGSTQANATVTGGQITLLRAASKVQIGLQFKSQLQTMRPDGGVQGGSSQSFTKSHAEVWFLLKDTIGGKAGPDFDTLDFIPSMSPAQLLGVAKGLQSGWQQIPWPADTGVDGYVCFEQSQPYPATLQAIVPRQEVGDA